MPLVGVCVDNGRVLIVTEFVTGGSLLSLVRRTRLPFPTIAKIGAEIASGVAHLHATSVVHRDLACRNILVDKASNRVRVADFGFARVLAGAVHQTRSSIGPVKWWPPESLQQHTHSAASDVYVVQVTCFWVGEGCCCLCGVWVGGHHVCIRWMLGCCLLEMLTGGRSPWPEVTPVDAALAVIRGDTPIDQVPAGRERTLACSRNKLRTTQTRKKGLGKLHFVLGGGIVHWRVLCAVCWC